VSVGPSKVWLVRRETLRKAEARRIALAAQGFGVPRLERAVTMRDVQAVASRLAQFQIDSINVVTRAHFMPLFSRLGPYDAALLERAAHQPPRRLFEYWGHAASLIDISLQPLLRFRMQPGFRDVWTGVERVAQQNADLIPFIREEVAARGPISARELEIAEQRDRSNWGWNWSRVKPSWSGCSMSARSPRRIATRSSRGSMTCPNESFRVPCSPCRLHRHRIRLLVWSGGPQPLSE
jgi:uncharacterized protein YcaQ